MKKTFLYLTILALGLTSCNLDIDQPVETPEVKTGSTVYQVSIPASMGPETKAVSFDGTNAALSTFAAGDKVYVYNETKNVMACDAEGNAIALTLTASDISNGGKNCTLAGALTFYKYESGSWNAVTVDDTDSYKLLYNLTEPATDDPKYSNFWYIEQDGTTAGIADYAVATTTLTDEGGVLKPASTVAFTNVQSMFRFLFVDESSNAINVKHLIIESKNYAVASFFEPLQPSTYPYIYDTYTPYYVTLTTPTTDYIYVALCINESEAVGDELTFRAVDADGKVYTGSKAAPSSGFVNGKYYFNTSAIILTHDAALDITTPDIVWTNPSTPIEPDYSGQYSVYPADFDITLSGTSRNCDFFFLNAGTVRLNGLDATGDVPFIYCGYNLNVELQNGSANTILNRGGDECVGASTLKLSGNGTLTVTANSPDVCGIRGTTNYSKDNSNNDNSTTTALDVSAQLAADGYIVKRSARTDNGDGTYTWTYTVYPTNVNLASHSDSFTARDGQVLTGVLLDGGRIFIAKGATVTLHDASINCSFANGLGCKGDATIILEGENTVSGGNGGAGIFVDNGKTLTIQGSGSLTATGSSSGNSGGAGIGGCYKYGGNIVIKGGTIKALAGTGAAGIGGGYTSGDSVTHGASITIEGGNVTAMGGANAAGIGSGDCGGGKYSFGNISISGGTVVATGGENAAGIGCGLGIITSNKVVYYNSCGDITISGGIVTAMGGENASGIGCGGMVTNGSTKYYSSYCGAITITGGTVTATSNNDKLPTIGSHIIDYDTTITVGGVTIGGGISSVAMTNNAVANSTTIGSFINGSAISIDSQNFRANDGAGDSIIGTVRSSWNSETKTWTLTPM